LKGPAYGVVVEGIALLNALVAGVHPLERYSRNHAYFPRGL
jgi:hypothetical protein